MSSILLDCTDRQAERLRARFEDAADIDANLHDTHRAMLLPYAVMRAADLGVCASPNRLRGASPASRTIAGARAVEERVLADEQDGVGPLARKGRGCRVDVAAGGGIEDVDLQSHGRAADPKSRNSRSRGTSAPIRANFLSCPRATIGHAAAAPPSNVTSCRRLIQSPRRRPKGGPAELSGQALSRF